LLIAQKKEVLAVLNDFDDIFVDKSNVCIVDFADIEPMKIKLLDDTPIYWPQYRLPLRHLEEVKKQVTEMLMVMVEDTTNLSLLRLVLLTPLVHFRNYFRKVWFLS
jgi:hypothetical protein